MIASGFQLEDEPADVGTRRLRLRGELDAHGADGLRAALRDRLDDQDRVVHLVLDGLQFIDSAGLRALVQVEDHLRVQGRRLVLEHPTSPVLQVIRIADLDDHFEIVAP